MQSNSAFKFVLLLALVSLFADIVYEGARSITGPFLGELGANAAIIGAVSGFGELFGYAFRLVSGEFADKTRAYWAITIVGYALNLLAVPALALAGNWWTAAFLLILERTGKAIRGPARDVMLSAAGSQLGPGFAFGLHQALDQVGAVVGPLAMAYGLWHHQQMRLDFAMLVIPGTVALALLLSARFLYPDPDELRVESKDMHSEGLDRTFWIYILASAMIAAGTMDYPLIAYHFRKAGTEPETMIPILYAIAMATDGVAGFALGKVFDRVGVKLMAGVSLITASAVPLIFALRQDMAGAAIWGIGLGAQSSIMKAFIATIVPKERRGAAYGIFALAYGVAWFGGSVLMGVLYEHSITVLIAFAVASQLLAVPLFIVVDKRT